MRFKDLVARESPVIFEIGANNGDDSVKLLNEFVNPIYHGFEPDKEVFNILEQRLSSFNGKIYLTCAAVSDFSGEAEFYVANNTYSSSLKKPVLHKEIYPSVLFDKKTIVKTITLDQYASDNNISYCDLAWIDVQGAEDLVIKGGTEFFKNTKYIYTEFSNVELYEKALNQFGIIELLPYFKMVAVIPEAPSYGNVLLENTRMADYL